MRYGVWTPLPHTIRPEPLMDEAIADPARGVLREALTRHSGSRPT